MAIWCFLGNNYYFCNVLRGKCPETIYHYIKY